MATEMAYNILNEGLFDGLWNSKFYKVSAIHGLCDDLMSIDYSVIASRREGQVSIQKFMDSGVPGSSIFDEMERFRYNGRGDLFVPDIDLNFYNCIIGLSAVLSHRTTTKAKDTSAAVSVAGAKTDKELDVANDAASQDNTKRFEELRKQLKQYTRVGNHTYNRSSFEARVATWVP